MFPDMHVEEKKPETMEEAMKMFETKSKVENKNKKTNKP